MADTPVTFLELPDRRKVLYTVRRSARARRLALRLSAEGLLTLVLPRGVPATAAAAFLQGGEAWIMRHLDRLAAKTKENPLPLRRYPDAFHFPVAAETFPVRYEWHDVCWVGAREHSGALEVTGAVLNPDAVHEALKQYLLRKAHFVFEPLVQRLASEHVFSYGKIAVRFQRRRWGSCSRTKNLSLNAQLLFLSPDEVRYILIHELCHTRVMDHSPRFWREVAKYCPDYGQIRARLRREKMDSSFR